MKRNSIETILCLLFLFLSFPDHGICIDKSGPKKIYMTYVLHGNMNYDRYVKPTIWRDFPVIYDNLLDYMEEHPDFKGQIQLSGQTFNSLKQTAPHVIEHAMKLYRNGQINFTGTFYSEPVNISMDGETNYRCAKLGTSIIEDAVGVTDGYYLQERAYHAQLPWILNHSKVSWVPVITDDNTFAPFRLKGMDGSFTIGVPNFSLARGSIVNMLKEAPANSLILIEGDYEIPQSFTSPYQEVSGFDKSNENIEVEWITVKEYLEKFGVSEEKYVDHSAKANYIEHGTYSRWTADPLDIIVQDYTNKAMSDFRAATIMDALAGLLFKESIDEPISDANISLNDDPVSWNIEHAGTYPDIEPKYLSRNGEVTVMSRAEHLLLWAVNSDARGWFPLYERRSERINSFKNSSSLSKEIINRGLDVIAQNLKVAGYDRYFVLFNAEPERSRVARIETDRPYAFYDYGSGQELRSTTISTGDKCITEFELVMPAYGYKVIGLKRSVEVKKYEWKTGTTIENGSLKLTASENKVVVESGNGPVELSLDSFKIKALAEMSGGKGDNEWRDAKPYSNARISVRNTIYPQLRVEKQIDWLVHMQQTFTLLPDRVISDVDFFFPHPTLISKEGEIKQMKFDPRGLTLQFKTGKQGKVYYDIPFGISPHQTDSLSYFCALSTGIFQFNAGGGFMISTGTGEQAFYTDSRKGEVGLYLGASTTSGPIRDVGMTIVNKGSVKHEPAWYLEPFHGAYKHSFMLYPFTGNWQENHTPAISRSYTQEVYLREFYPTKNSGQLPDEKSLISVDQPGIEITSMDISDGKVSLRLNDKEGKASKVKLNIGDKTKTLDIPANGIIDIKW
jgi:hypothetical protein